MSRRVIQEDPPSASRPLQGRNYYRSSPPQSVATGARTNQTKLFPISLLLLLRVNTLPGKLEHATEGIRRPFWKPWDPDNHTGTVRVGTAHWNRM
jgi:hypothetical protein